jgi:hypothetical protein
MPAAPSITSNGLFQLEAFFCLTNKTPRQALRNMKASSPQTFGVLAKASRSPSRNPVDHVLRALQKDRLKLLSGVIWRLERKVKKKKRDPDLRNCIKRLNGARKKLRTTLS